MDDSGWTTVASNKPVDMSRMKLTKQSVDENSLQLGPGFRPGQSWGRGSTGGSKQPETDNKPPMYGNRFSALGDRSRGAGRGVPPSPRGASDQRSSGRPLQSMGSQGGKGRPMGPRGSSEQEREAALAAVRSISGGNQYSQAGSLVPGGSRGNSRPGSRDNSRPSSRDNSRSRDNSSSRADSRDRQRDDRLRVSELGQRDSSLTRPDDQAQDSGDQVAPGKAPVMSEEALELKAKAIIDEYLHNDDKKEAINCIRDLQGQKMSVIATHFYNHVLERSEAARKKTASLLHDCVKLDYIKHEDYLTGVRDVVEFAEDNEIDVPKIWQYLGELVGPMMEDGLIPLSCLSSICLPIPTHNKRGKLVMHVLHYISSREGHGKTGDLWRQSGLNWNEFVQYEGEEFKEFIRVNKLEYTIAKERTKSCSERELTFEEIGSEIQSLLKKSSEDEEIFDWIEVNVGDVRCKESKFIRVLMTEVCSSAIKVTSQGSSSKCEKIPNVLHNRSHLLRKYIDNQPELEQQALYSLQILVHKLEHPPGLLNWVFEELYDDDVISEDAFRSWQSTDPRDMTGYGVAKQSVKSFLASLDRSDEPSSPAPSQS